MASEMPNMTMTGGDWAWCAPCRRLVSKKDAQHVGSVAHLMGMGLSKPAARARARKHHCQFCEKGFTRPRDVTRHWSKCSMIPTVAEKGRDNEQPSEECVQGTDRCLVSRELTVPIRSGPSDRGCTSAGAIPTSTTNFDLGRGRYTFDERFSAVFTHHGDVVESSNGIQAPTFSPDISPGNDTGSDAASIAPTSSTEYQVTLHDTSNPPIADYNHPTDLELEEIKRIAESQAERDAADFAQAIVEDDRLAARNMLSGGYYVSIFLVNHDHENSHGPMRAFALAAYYGRTQILRCMMQHEMRPEILGPVQSDYPLIDLLTSRDFGCADILVKAGVSVHQNAYGQTLLEHFAFRGCSASVKLLVGHGAQVTAQALDVPLEKLTSHEYARSRIRWREPGELAGVEYLDVLRCLHKAQNWASPAVFGEFLEVALPKAVASKREDLVRWLIQAGADIHQKAGFLNGSALQDASQLGDVEMISQLFSNGFNANSDAGYLSLCIAARLANTQVIELLVAYGAPVNLIARLGHSPFYFAAQTGHENNARALFLAAWAQNEAPEGAIWVGSFEHMYKDVYIAHQEWEAVVKPTGSERMLPRMQPMVDMLKKIING